MVTSDLEKKSNDEPMGINGDDNVKALISAFIGSYRSENSMASQEVETTMTGDDNKANTSATAQNGASNLKPSYDQAMPINTDSVGKGLTSRESPYDSLSSLNEVATQNGASNLKSSYDQAIPINTDSVGIGLTSRDSPYDSLSKLNEAVNDSTTADETICNSPEDTTNSSVHSSDGDPKSLTPVVTKKSDKIKPTQKVLHSPRRTRAMTKTDKS
jgi:hypothetical protein